MQLVRQTLTPRPLLTATPAALEALEKKLRRAPVRLVTTRDRQAAYQAALANAQTRYIDSFVIRTKAKTVKVERKAIRSEDEASVEALMGLSGGVWGGTGLRMDYFQNLSHIDSYDYGDRARGFNCWKSRRWSQYRANARHNCHGHSKRDQAKLYDMWFNADR